MSKKILKTASYLAASIILGIILGFGIQFARAWTEPNTAPPGNILGTPINTGNNLQMKDGNLSVNIKSDGSNGDWLNGLTVGGNLNVPYGNVGIGTASPSKKLEVSSGGFTGVQLRLSGYNNARQWDLNNDSAGFGIMFNGNAEAIKIAENGNVGIGTTNPAGKLDVLGPTNDVNFRVQDSVGNGFYNVAGNTLNFNYGNNAYSSGWINFRGYNNGATQYRDLIIGDGRQNAIASFIASTGNVGIGTMSPGAKLDVYGISRFRDYVTLMGGETYSGYIGKADSIISGGGAGELGIRSVGKLYLASNDDATSRLTIDNGNVGIGTTTPGVKLEVAGATQVGSWFRTQGTDGRVNIETNRGENRILSMDRDDTVSQNFLIAGHGVGSIDKFTVDAKNSEFGGQVKITGGSPGAGKVLTSDSSGLASWITPTTACTGFSTWHAAQAERNSKQICIRCNAGVIELKYQNDGADCNN
jgi:hypothetical protein